MTIAHQAGLASIDSLFEHSPIAAKPARSIPPNPLAVSLRALQSAHLLESPCHQANCQIAGEVVPIRNWLSRFVLWYKHNPWYEQQLPRAGVVLPPTTAGQLPQPGPQVLQQPAQCDRVAQDRGDLQGQPLDSPSDPHQADPAQRATAQERPLVLHHHAQQLGVRLAQHPVALPTPRPSQAASRLPGLVQKLDLPANTIKDADLFECECLRRQVGNQYRPPAEHPL